MSLRHTESAAGGARWLGPMSLLMLVPKCVVCVIAYAGLGGAIGGGGLELCGGDPDATGAGLMSSVANLLAGLGLLTVIGMLGGRRLGRRP